VDVSPVFTISERTDRPLLYAQEPYEDFCFSFINVIKVDKKWHMWYLSYDHKYKDDQDGFLCYASSSDGVNWKRPNMGMVEYNGNKNNNIIISGAQVGGFHGQCVFIDSKAPVDEWFKMVYSRLVNNQWLLFGAASKDGIHWKLSDKPILNYNSDTQATCFRDGDVYRLYMRMWSKGDFKGKRIVGYSESKTFSDFPQPKPVFEPDNLDPDELQFYNSAVSKIDKNFYIMFPSGFYTKAGLVKPHLAISSNGTSFKRPSHEAFLSLGKDFDSAGIYITPGLIQSDKPGYYWAYYIGNKVKHDDNSPNKAKFDGGVGRFLLKISK
jgi:predicted GH43/DUF377 family glycosyl hydrolase